VQIPTEEVGTRKTAAARPNRSQAVLATELWVQEHFRLLIADFRFHVQKPIFSSRMMFLRAEAITGIQR